MNGEALAALDGRRVGPHLPLRGNMVKAVARAVEIGATAIQIFSDNPTAWRRRSEPPAELPAFWDRLREADIRPLAIHAPYLINLAAPDDTIWEKSVLALAGELAMAARYRAVLLNVHIGSHRGSGDEAGLRRIGRGIARVLAEVPSRSLGDSGEAAEAVTHVLPLLVLENSAGGGDGMGSTVEELARILQAIEAAGGDAARVGLCLDTAHAWAAGYEISRPDATDRLLAELDATVGPERLVMLHLNDSKAAFGSHLDRHEHVGAGSIGPVGMAHVLRHPRLAGLPYYLETPGMDEGYDALNMDRVRRLIQGLPLEPLPVEPPAARPARPRGRRATT